MPNDTCDHKFIRDGEVRRSLGNSSYQTWTKYVCERCLKPQFALVYDYNSYVGRGEDRDGTRIVDSMEKLR